MAASLRQDSPVSPSHQPTFDQRFKPDLVNKIEVSNSGDVNGVVKIRCGHKKISYDLLKYVIFKVLSHQSQSKMDTCATVVY